MSFSKVILLGNLSRDPEVKYSSSGSAVTSFSVAVNRKWKSNTGEMKEEVSFIDSVAFGGTAELISKNYQKGSQILIDGYLKQNTWEKDGQKRSKIVVIVERVEFLRGEPKAEPREKQETKQPEYENDDIPF